MPPSGDYFHAMIYTQIPVPHMRVPRSEGFRGTESRRCPAMYDIEGLKATIEEHKARTPEEIMEGIDHADLSAHLWMKTGAGRRHRLGGRAPGSWFMFIRRRCYRAGVPDGVVLATES